MPNGYTGRILRVNLSNESFELEEPDEKFYRRYMGGRALIAYYLLTELKKGIDPLGPENKLIFSSGVITGAPISGCGRNSIGAKSPLTGGYGDGEVGEHWGAELKRAGWDAIIFEGKAGKPLYLLIKDGDVELRDASKLWGMDTGDAIAAVRRELNDDLIRVSVIGRGGENMVRYACIMNGGHDAAGRCGLGAVMGSKKLKAVAVKGTGRVDIADSSVLTELSNKLSKRLPGYWAHELGTGGHLDGFALTGNLPYRNFRDGDFPNYDDISGYALKERGLRIGMNACWACMVRCKKVVKIDEENLKVDPFYGGPEYETIAALGSCCGVDDIKAICKASELCNRHSLDVISCGVTIAFAMECFERGLITKEDTGGLELLFGDGETVMKMVDRISKREGFGGQLAEGCKRLAEKIGKGASEYAVHVKGQEVPMHEPRYKRGLGVGYALSSTGADHNHNLHDPDVAYEEKLGDFRPFGVIESVSVEDIGPKKIRVLNYWLKWMHAFDCLHMCIFIPWSPKEVLQITEAVTGWDTSLLEISTVGERAINLTRIFNVREGFTAADDTLPPRFYRPHTSGALSKNAVDEKGLHEAVKTYYRMMGWDTEGVPSREKLEELDIAWAHDHLK
ncbi:MAG: aldehyde ferredoxin oxidoreductase family protein [Candidatus Bathyarchaeota archaeon]